MVDALRAASFGSKGALQLVRAPDRRTGFRTFATATRESHGSVSTKMYQSLKFTFLPSWRGSFANRLFSRCVKIVSADYLAALWPEKAVYHLPNGPLSFPTELSATERHNPTIASQLNESTSLFDAAYSMSLPSLCDVGQIEAVVSKISRSLKARGVLNLILIDPTPNVGALGERLRTWLLENLLLNLERNSRCLYPSILLPHLLGAASLRGPGSTLVKARFYANPQNIGRHGEKETSADKEVRRDEEIRAELRSTVGCMLWREVWGGFVTSDTWWWDDAACMQECLERGTFWEYYFIRAIKPD